MAMGAIQAARRRSHGPEGYDPAVRTTWGVHTAREADGRKDSRSRTDQPRGRQDGGRMSDGSAYTSEPPGAPGRLADHFQDNEEERRARSFAAIRKKHASAVFEPPVHWIESNQADVVIGVVIILNCFVIGIETDLRSETSSEIQVGWYILDNIFTILFTIEWAVRIRANGVKKWASSGWNLFDFLLVGISVVDTYILTPTMNAGGLRAMSTLRMARLLRLVRAVRLVRMFPELALLIAGLARAVKAMFWVVILMVVVMYIMAILLVRFLGKPNWDARDCSPMWAWSQFNVDEQQSLKDAFATGSLSSFAMQTYTVRSGYDCEFASKRFRYYGTVLQAMYAMFIVMTGEGWIDICDTATHYIPAMVWLFIGYIFFSNIALINLVTGVIVDSVYETKADQAKKNAAEKAEKEIIKFGDTFDEAISSFGSRSDGPKDELGKDEFIEAIASRGPFQQALDELNICTDRDLADLFKVFDRNNNGSLTREEFVAGCVRCQGSTLGYAKHVLSVQSDVTHFGHLLVDGLEQLKSRVEKQRRLMSAPPSRRYSNEGRDTERFKRFDSVLTALQDIRQQQARLTDLVVAAEEEPTSPTVLSPTSPQQPQQQPLSPPVTPPLSPLSPQAPNPYQNPYQYHQVPPKPETATRVRPAVSTPGGMLRPDQHGHSASLVSASTGTSAAVGMGRPADSLLGDDSSQWSDSEGAWPEEDGGARGQDYSTPASRGVPRSRAPDPVSLAERVARARQESLNAQVQNGQHHGEWL